MRYLFLILFPILLSATELPPSSETETTATEEIAPNLNPDIYQKQFYKTFIVTLIIVVGSLALIWYVRKFSKDHHFQTNHKKNIKILERRQISPNTYLYHIQIGSKQIVISESKNDVRVVANLDWETSEITN